ncbi:hypothetical protein [Noviherbaspirillum suwonense]|uniref:Uncharacterized protein n=1 Tax=Noviherbaspirillum suwonense TaxID=1224511 RepID=A0ABY1PXU7_9BURK|nr:hypothetical protein [Noviherbaspirillum suwonense]SMP51845.1 hypothetical protein SAMN06295970_10364 [Noviherbaspirillum suwonense]
MIQKLKDFSPNARRILNEIMTLLFAPEAAIGGSISNDQIGALIAQFGNAAKSEVTTVKCLLSKLLGQLETLESQIELREIEEAKRVFKAALEAQEKRLRTMRPIQAERLRNEARQNLREWRVTDQAVVLQKIKSKELLTLPEFLATRKVSKKTVSIAIAWGRMFSITGADGQDYYPAFFADSNDYVRQCLGKVCQALGDIPAYAKYQFLVTDFHSLVNGGTPLHAIRFGRVDNVLQAIKWLLQP